MAKYSAKEAKEMIDKGIVHSDVEALEKMTDEEIHEAALSDPDAQPATEEEAQEFKPAVHRGQGVYAHEKKPKNKQEGNNG
jgi:hypothetical protein